VVENPWYKVLVGDFRTKEEAEKYLEIIHKIGFEDAFVRESPINLQNDDRVYPKSGP
jgi:cell division protein FtsN